MICAEGSQQFDEEAVAKTQKLVRLSAYCNSTYVPLRGEFALLEYFHLGFAEDEPFLGSFAAPHPKTLSLRYGDGESYFWTSRCAGIRLQALEVLELDSYPGDDCCDRDEDFDVCSFNDGVYMDLMAAKNIQILDTKSRVVLNFVPELLEDSSSFQDHHFTLKYLGHTMKLGQGEERPNRIAAFRSEAMLEDSEDGVGPDGEEESSSDDE